MLFWVSVSLKWRCCNLYESDKKERKKERVFSRISTIFHRRGCGFSNGSFPFQTFIVMNKTSSPASDIPLCTKPEQRRRRNKRLTLTPKCVFTQVHWSDPSVHVDGWRRMWTWHVHRECWETRYWPAGRRGKVGKGNGLCEFRLQSKPWSIITSSRFTPVWFSNEDSY